MARKIFEFKCVDDHIFEAYCSFEDKHMDCRVCGKPASRIISAPQVALEGVSGDFPGAAMKWERKHTEHLRKSKAL